MTLIVLCAPPGAGKTTWLADNLTGVHEVISTEVLKNARALGHDARRAYLAEMHERADLAVAQGFNVLIDACHTRVEQRRRWLDLAARHGTPSRLVVVHAGLAALLAVQQERDDPIPERVIRSYYGEWLAALAVIDAEGWDEVQHVHRVGSADLHVSRRVQDSGSQQW